MFSQKRESRDYRNDTVAPVGLRSGGRRYDTDNDTDTVILGGIQPGRMGNPISPSIISRQSDNYREGGLRANVSSNRTKVIQRRPKRTSPEQIANDMDTLEYLRGLTDRNGDEEREYKRLYNVCATRKSRAKNMT